MCYGFSCNKTKFLTTKLCKAFRSLSANYDEVVSYQRCALQFHHDYHVTCHQHPVVFHQKFHLDVSESTRTRGNMWQNSSYRFCVCNHVGGGKMSKSYYYFRMGAIQTRYQQTKVMTLIYSNQEDSDLVDIPTAMETTCVWPLVRLLVPAQKWTPSLKVIQ